MAVNMEVGKSTSKEVDTQLSASNSMEFKDGVRRENNENVRDLRNSYSPLDDKTINSHKYDRTIVYAQLDDAEVFVNELPDNRVLGNKEEGNSIRNKEKEITEDMKVLQNDSKDQQAEVMSENSTDGYAHQAPLAFTIDFGNKEVDTTKYQNLFERYNARHKRNLSTSKVGSLINLNGKLMKS